MDKNKGEIWQDFIRKEIEPVRLFSQPPEAIDIASYLERSASLRETFIDRLIGDAIAPYSEDQMKVLIHGYQTLLCYLSNQVVIYRQQVLSRPDQVGLYDRVLLDLDANLLFLQTYFDRYFDQSAQVPKSHQNTYRNTVQQHESALRASFNGIETDSRLLEVILFVLKRQADIPLPFMRLSYLNQFLDGLAALCQSDRPNLFDSRLMEYSILQNFNDPAFIECVFTLFRENLQHLETGEEKKQWLGHRYKFINQLVQHPDAALFAGSLSVRDSLLYWLEQENVYGQAGQKENTVAASDASHKLNTSVSVPVLALLTRVFKEAGIITNSNLQEIFRFVSTHYTTQRKESISQGNFHGKYYKVDEATKRKVSDLLLEMVKVVKRIA